MSGAGARKIEGRGGGDTAAVVADILAVMKACGEEQAQTRIGQRII